MHGAQSCSFMIDARNRSLAAPGRQTQTASLTDTAPASEICTSPFRPSKATLKAALDPT